MGDQSKVSSIYSVCGVCFVSHSTTNHGYASVVLTTMSIAVDLDRIQCKMLATTMLCTRMPNEDLEGFCRRRLREARNASQLAGF